MFPHHKAALKPLRPLQCHPQLNNKLSVLIWETFPFHRTNKTTLRSASSRFNLSWKNKLFSPFIPPPCMHLLPSWRIITTKANWALESVIRLRSTAAHSDLFFHKSFFIMLFIAKRKQPAKKPSTDVAEPTWNFKYLFFISKRQTDFSRTMWISSNRWRITLNSIPYGSSSQT